MKLYFPALAVFYSFVHAGEFALDPACGDSIVPGARDGIVKGLQEAVDMASNALQVLENHGDDMYVKDLIKYIYGDDDRDQVMQHVQTGLRGVASYDKTISPLSPYDDAWLNTHNNDDIGVYCSLDRLGPHRTNPAARVNTHNLRVGISAAEVPSYERCHDRSFVLTEGTSAAKAFTLPSMITDINEYLKAHHGPDWRNAKKSDFQTPSGRPGNMDICSWFLKFEASEGWPVVDRDRIERVRSEEFISGLKETQRPVDHIKTLGVTMVHELTHTTKGGLFRDVDDNGNENCYNWICIRELASMAGGRNNSDSLAMLAMLLKVWTLGYYVDERGYVHPKPE